MKSRICTEDVEQTLLTLVEIVYLGIVIVDKKGRVTLINEKLAAFFNVDGDEVIGKHITELMENTTLHEIAGTGQAGFDGIQVIRDQKMIVSCAPVINDQGESVGAIQKISFQSRKEIEELIRRLRLLEGKVEHYKKELEKSNSGSYALENILSWNDRFNELKVIARRAAHSSATVLIIGESGTGKELFAHAVHHLSQRRNEPFIKVNCAAIPDNLLESELFGYDYGAFSGAKKGGKPGKFELADKGTLFLDEIGDMPLSMQAKLLRVLQDKVIERVGGTESKRVDMRIIAATNKNLRQLIAEGKFREDLYYRLNVITLEIPPLRPGNVRQLENCIERIMNLHVGAVIEPNQLPSDLFTDDQDIHSPFVEDDYRNTILVEEKKIVEKALIKCNGNKTKAAKMLGISRSTFYDKLKGTGLG